MDTQHLDLSADVFTELEEAVDGGEERDTAALMYRAGLGLKGAGLS